MKNNNKNNVVSFKDKRKQYKKKKAVTKKQSYKLQGKPDLQTYLLVCIVIALCAAYMTF